MVTIHGKSGKVKVKFFWLIEFVAIIQKENTGYGVKRWR